MLKPDASMFNILATKRRKQWNLFWQKLLELACEMREQGFDKCFFKPQCKKKIAMIPKSFPKLHLVKKFLQGLFLLATNIKSWGKMISWNGFQKQGTYDGLSQTSHSVLGNANVDILCIRDLSCPSAGKIHFCWQKANIGATKVTGKSCPEVRHLSRGVVLQKQIPIRACLGDWAAEICICLSQISSLGISVNQE